MDWTRAIDRNREALLRILAMLFAAAGLAKDGSVAMLPPLVRCKVLRLLRPAESATRRLIVSAARGLCVAPRPVSAPAGPIARGTGDRTPSFPLFDPRKRFAAAQFSPAGTGPRIAVIGLDDPVFTEQQQPDNPVSAKRLCRRLQALQRALDDLPRQARRFARWQARRHQARSGWTSPLRPGWPPGHRARSRHEVDDILSDCHALARHALKPPDSS